MCSVLGAGNTAVDVATAARRLGAEKVTIAYRRGEASIPAFAYEYHLARTDGVQFAWHAQPLRIVAREGRAVGVEFGQTVDDGSTSRRGTLRLVPGSEFVIEADMIVKALGQEPLIDRLLARPMQALDSRAGPNHRRSADGGHEASRGCSPGAIVSATGARVVDAVRDGKVSGAWGSRFTLARLRPFCGRPDFSRANLSPSMMDWPATEVRRPTQL